MSLLLKVKGVMDATLGLVPINIAPVNTIRTKLDKKSDNNWQLIVF